MLLRGWHQDDWQRGGWHQDDWQEGGWQQDGDQGGDQDFKISLNMRCYISGSIIQVTW